MSKDFPAWRYDPETKEGQIFDTADDVPDGWVARLGEAPEPKAKPAKVEKVKEPEPVVTPPVEPGREPMTRKEITTALQAGGIPYKVTGKTEELAELLHGKVMEVLTKRNIAFDADADTRDLLALVQA